MLPKTAIRVKKSSVGKLTAFTLLTNRGLERVFNRRIYKACATCRENVNTFYLAVHGN